MESLIEALVSTIPQEPPDPELDDRLALLLADFLACVSADQGRTLGDPFDSDGTAGAAAVLALRCSISDLDDVDWRSLHHPGSVVWPIVVALAATSGISGDRLGRAARSGYATAATIADHLGPVHRSSWHVTATAGALGSASAACVMLDLPPEVHGRALALAAVNTGGLALAARERRGAAVFNRAAAVTLGLLAARAASAGAVAVQTPFSDPGGLFETMSGEERVGELRVRDGVRDAAARIYPVTGFLQSAVHSVAALRSGMDGELRGIRIDVAEGARRLVDDEAAGSWWSARSSALRAWAGGSPYLAGTPCALDGRVDLVRVRGVDLPPGCSNVAVVTDGGEDAILGARPPALSDPGALTELQDKWARVLGLEDLPVLEIARNALTETGYGVELRRRFVS